MTENGPFTFAISLSVLNHLGRNLYRSFVTVLGEAISNSWDADAKNVQIFINKDENSFFIRDDGEGMSASDFQNKFLKIGYSKRRDGRFTSESGRPLIGRKGIGKLALLSCAETVTIITKTFDGDYVGGRIENSGLDEAIKNDLEPDSYPLGKVDPNEFLPYLGNFSKGTIIQFKNLKEGIRNSFKFIRKAIALYFRFSLLDSAFNIFLNDEPITLDDLNDLAKETEFVWIINHPADPFLSEKLSGVRKTGELNNESGDIKGFVASVEKPTNLKIFSTDERAGVDLFVNGRLREKDILKHIPTARIAESYLYGQIHYDNMDDNEDRFTSSREGIVSDDPKFRLLLEGLSPLIGKVINNWDEWRLEIRKEGDPENPRLTKKERSSRNLYNAVADEFVPPSTSTPENRKKVDSWVNDLMSDAQYNFASYAECFVSENLIRKQIEAERIPFTEEAKRDISEYKSKEESNKQKGNISIDIRKNNDDLGYLSMDGLANMVDKVRNPAKEAGLSRDAAEYKPIRDALMHTSLLTDEAKNKLSTTSSNIKGRVKTLIQNGDGK